MIDRYHGQGEKCVRLTSLIIRLGLNVRPIDPTRATYWVPTHLRRCNVFGLCGVSQWPLKKCSDWNYKSMNSFTVDLSLIMLCLDRLFSLHRPTHSLADTICVVFMGVPTWSGTVSPPVRPSVRPSIKCNLQQLSIGDVVDASSLWSTSTTPPAWFDFESNREAAAEPLT